MSDWQPGWDVERSDFDRRWDERSARAAVLGYDPRSLPRGFAGLDFNREAASGWMGDGAGGLTYYLDGELLGSPDGDADAALVREVGTSYVEPDPTPGRADFAAELTTQTPDAAGMRGAGGGIGLPKWLNLWLALLVALVLVGCWLLEQT